MEQISSKVKIDLVLKLIFSKLKMKDVVKLGKVCKLFYKHSVSNSIWKTLLENDFLIPKEWLITKQEHSKCFYSLYANIFESFPLQMSPVSNEAVLLKFTSNPFWPNQSPYRELSLVRGHIAIEDAQGFGDIICALFKNSKIEWGWTTNVGRLAIVAKDDKWLNVQMELIMEGNVEIKSVCVFVPIDFFFAKYWKYIVTK